MHIIQKLYLHYIQIKSILYIICTYFRVVLDMFWGCFGDVLGMFQGCFGDVLGMFWDVLWMFWGCFGNVLGMFYGCFGDFLFLFWFYIQFLHRPISGSWINFLHPFRFWLKIDTPKQSSWLRFLVQKLKLRPGRQRRQTPQHFDKPKGEAIN